MKKISVLLSVLISTLVSWIEKKEVEITSFKRQIPEPASLIKRKITYY